MKTTTQIVLEAHRENLITTSTFEEYKVAHLKFLDLLIAKEALKDQEDNLDLNFVSTTDCLMRTAP